ncbi:Putative Pc13g06420 protein [[Torrubiella] hemipterigena]|uniref:Putative Pc13g06420 protein n=1 Tax=[Torrubiella] hemipterigena TaxID=1531966 RepID=A0A0A1TK24_9HYPO|nr:Putative Pc13g06420 protein [[Torrubiella] hemipterigena]
MSVSSSSVATSATKSWQERLEDLCRDAQISPPVFQLLSDRRGGRTAWSSQVTVQGKTHAARFWYDGNNLNNAKEDAAECAINWLNSQPNRAAASPW